MVTARLVAASFGTASAAMKAKRKEGLEAMIKFWEVKSFCSLIDVDTKLSDRLTAGLLNLSMIWHELSYEFLGFQEILGALSLLFSTTLLVLTIFVKRLKQGAARVRQQAGS